MADTDYYDVYRCALVRELLAKLWVEERGVLVGFGFADVRFRMVATQVLGETVRRVSGQPRHVAVIGLAADQPFPEQRRTDFRYRYDVEVLVYPVEVDGHGREDHRPPTGRARRAADVGAGAGRGPSSCPAAP